MKTWTVFDPADGLFTGQVIKGSGNALEANVPQGMRAVAGLFDRICQRVDIETGRVVDHQPPQPDEDHEWLAENPSAKDRAGQRWRWTKKADVLEREQRRTTRQLQIEELERKKLPRILLELSIDPDAVGADGKTPRQRRDELEAQISALRAQR